MDRDRPGRAGITDRLDWTGFWLTDDGGVGPRDPTPGVLAARQRTAERCRSPCPQRAAGSRTRKRWPAAWFRRSPGWGATRWRTARGCGLRIGRLVRPPVQAL